MRSFLVRSLWPAVRSDLMLGAMVLGCLGTIHSCPAQEAPAPDQDKKPPAAPTKPGARDSGTGPTANMAQMMQKMMGRPGAGGMAGKMGAGMGQPAQPAEPTLEEMLNKALKDNPDIRVAEAKVREADAELNRTRLQVTQKVLAFYHSRESQKAIVKAVDEYLQRLQKMKEAKAASQADVKVEEGNLRTAKAKLAEIEAEMPYLLGQQQKTVHYIGLLSPDGKIGLSAAPEWATPVTIRDAKTGQTISFNATVSGPTRSTPEAATVTEKLLKALDTPMTVDYQDKPIDEIFKEMEKRVPGLSIQVQIPAPDEDDLRRLTLKGQFSMRAVLELMEDTFSVRMNPEPQTRYTFAVREYGLLFAPNDRIPREAVRLHDLQKEIRPPKAEKDQEKQKR